MPSSITDIDDDVTSKTLLDKENAMKKGAKLPNVPKKTKSSTVKKPASKPTSSIAKVGRPMNSTDQEVSVKKNLKRPAEALQIAHQNLQSNAQNQQDLVLPPTPKRSQHEFGFAENQKMAPTGSPDYESSSDPANESPANGSSSAPANESPANESSVAAEALPVKRQIAVRQMNLNDPNYGKITSKESADLTRIATYKRITIQMRDIFRLQPEKYLNDTLIDFGCSFLENQFLSNTRKKTMVIPTQFFETLISTGEKYDDGTDKELFLENGQIPLNYNGRWEFNCAKVLNYGYMQEFFSNDIIVVPMNQDKHWMLAVIVNPTGVYFEGDETHKPLCRIIFFNSLPNDTRISRHFKSVLERIIMKNFQKHGPCKTARFEAKQIKFSVADNIPQQSNYIDCGLFALHFAERVFKNLDRFVRICKKATQILDCSELFRDANKTKKADLREPLLAKIMSKATKDGIEHVNRHKWQLKQVEQE